MALIEGGGYEVAKDSAPRQLTVTARLYNERDRLMSRLEEVNAAISALEEDPKIQGVVDSLSKLGHF